MEIRSGMSLSEALVEARRGAYILRATIDDMERALLRIDALLTAAAKKSDETKATVLAESAAQRSYREQESFVKAFTDAMKDAECCEDEEGSEE